MKIIFISNDDRLSLNDCFKYLELFCHQKEDIILFNSLSKAKNYILDTVISKQKHIDFIITDWKFDKRTSKVILNDLRNSEYSYSANNFQVKSLPIILIEDSTNTSAAISDGYDGVITGKINDHEKLRHVVKSTIKNWRYKLADDLELIGMNPQTLEYYPNDRYNFISYYKLQVISRDFVDSKSKKLNYLWLNSNPNILMKSNELFDEFLKSTRYKPPRFLEKEIHNFFLSNPTFLKGEDYFLSKDYMLYEKHFYKNNTRFYDEPDFINKPYIHSLKNPEIFEIKRHTHRLFTRKGDKFLSSAKKSFNQVKRYKKYFNNPDIPNQYFIQKYLGQLYDTYDYTLLLGTIDEKLENNDILEKLMEDFDFKDINLISYDELLEKHVKLCNSLSDFDIFN